MTDDARPPSGGDPGQAAQRAALAAALPAAGLSAEQLWTRYFALGGDLDPLDVEAFTAELVALAPQDGDLLAHVVNERLDELAGRSRVPYHGAVRQRRPAVGPLAALVTLLEESHHAPPDRLPLLAARAGRALGVQVRVLLVDEEQQSLVAVPPSDTERFAVEGTLAGRAFRGVQLLPGEADRRLWIPLLDGEERMGVLEVGVATAADLYDPVLRDHCRWLAAVLGHLVSSKAAYGDTLARVRRTRPHTPAAELVHAQLPPLTAATDTVSLAGVVEPSHAAGGDVFDYAVTEDDVTLAVLDAVGHGMPAGLRAVAALAAHRSARRDGREVHEQAAVLDDVLTAEFAHGFVTGVLARLDLRSGLLRYVNAGHPAPLLVRGGRVVKALAGGRRLPFGLETAVAAGPVVAEESLEPGDWLVLYTDGITEARDPAGRWFGEERLLDFLTRELAAGSPPPETARRLTRAVLRHQQGLLQDDATVLLARWAGPPHAATVP
jgi:hypothetical protein